LEEEDIFVISGQSKKGIKVRIIGGDGDDLVQDDSKIGGLGRKTKIYDPPGGIEIEGGKETVKLPAKKTEVNEYDREAFIYDAGFPSISLGFTPDHGVWLGAGGSYTTHGFRKDPYKSSQRLDVLYAPDYGFINADYTGDYGSSGKIFKFNY